MITLGEFQALIIGEDLRRVTEQVEASDLLGRSLEVAAAQADARWDVVVAGDHLEAIGKAARNALDGTTSPFRRVVQAVFGGVRGEGLPALVQQLGLAANRAAGLRWGTHTAFVFKDASLVNSLANHVGGGPRLVDRREQHGLVAVLAKPGQDLPWRK